MLLVHMATAIAQYSYIDKERAFEKYAGYCQPRYGAPDEKSPLKRLLVMFRHGDRAPLSMEGSRWKDEECVHCEDKKCGVVQCGPGLLTVKGFKQGRMLGGFIRSSHPQLLEGTVRAVHTEINRTQATLAGVLLGLGKAETPISVDRALVAAQECVDFRDSLAHPQDINVDYIAFDNYMTSICNGIPLNCDLLSCVPSVIEKTVNDEVKGYGDLMSDMRLDFAVNAVGFAELAKTLLSAFRGEERLVLMAAHDSTVSKLLNGLNIDETGIPPYASAVFIGVFADKHGTETVRVTYEGRAQRFGPGLQQHMDYSSFLAYLEAFAGRSEGIGQLCNAFNTNGGSERSDVLDLFEPQFVSSFLENAAVIDRSAGAISSYLISVGHGLLEASNRLFGRVSKLLKSSRMGDKSHLSRSRKSKRTKTGRKKDAEDGDDAECGGQAKKCSQSCSDKVPCDEEAECAPDSNDKTECAPEPPCDDKAECAPEPPCKSQKRGEDDACGKSCHSRKQQCSKKMKKRDCKAKATACAKTSAFKSPFKCAPTAKYTFYGTDFHTQCSTRENSLNQPCAPLGPCTPGNGFP